MQNSSDMPVSIMNVRGFVWRGGRRSARNRVTVNSYLTSPLTAGRTLDFVHFTPWMQGSRSWGSWFPSLANGSNHHRGHETHENHQECSVWHGSLPFSSLLVGHPNAVAIDSSLPSMRCWLEITVSSISLMISASANASGSIFIGSVVGHSLAVPVPVLLFGQVHNFNPGVHGRLLRGP